MFFEQYSHEPPIAGNRYTLRYMADRTGVDQLIAMNVGRGENALRIMDGHLAQHSWFSGGQYGIADIALYAYTHVADEGGFDLSPHLHIERWLDDVRDQPGHIGLLQETSASCAPIMRGLGWPGQPRQLPAFSAIPRS